MKRFVKLTLVVLALADPAAFATEAGNADAGAKAGQAARPWNFKTPNLDRAQIDALLARPDQVLFVDVRRPDEISKIGSFPVYLNVQIGDLEKNAAFIPRERTIVTVSNHAGRAGAAGDLLRAKGFKVRGAAGSQNYEEEGGAITRIAPASTNTADAGKP